jgi:NADPH2:quinone reductase
VVIDAKTMKAWISATPGLAGLSTASVSRPVPGPREALARIEAAALNFSDLLMIDDRYQIRPPRPFIPGQEIAGTIVSAGESSELSIGDRIAAKVLWGGFAEFAVVRDDMAIRVPGNMSLEHAAALPVVYVTALVALSEATVVRPGEIVLVLAAAGGVGLAAVEIAHHLGARVIAAAGGGDKCALAKQHGAHETIDYRHESWSDQVKALTNGHGVDVIVDPVGGDATREALRAIAWNGRLMVVGFASGEIPQIPANRLLLRRASAVGVYWDHDRDAAMLSRVSSELTRLAQQRTIRPHVGGTYPFEALPAALSDLAQRRITGKAVIDLRHTGGAA